MIKGGLGRPHPEATGFYRFKNLKGIGICLLCSDFYFFFLSFVIS